MSGKSDNKKSTQRQVNVSTCLHQWDKKTRMFTCPDFGKRKQLTAELGRDVEKLDKMKLTK